MFGALKDNPLLVIKTNFAILEDNTSPISKKLNAIEEIREILHSNLNESNAEDPLLRLVFTSHSTFETLLSLASQQQNKEANNKLCQTSFEILHLLSLDDENEHDIFFDANGFMKIMNVITNTLLFEDPDSNKSCGSSALYLLRFFLDFHPQKQLLRKVFTFPNFLSGVIRHLFLETHRKDIFEPILLLSVLCKDESNAQDLFSTPKVFSWLLQKANRTMHHHYSKLKNNNSVVLVNLLSRLILLNEQNQKVVKSLYLNVAVDVFMKEFYSLALKATSQQMLSCLAGINNENEKVFQFWSTTRNVWMLCSLRQFPARIQNQNKQWKRIPVELIRLVFHMLNPFVLCNQIGGI